MADEPKQPEQKRQEPVWPSGAIPRDKIKKWGALAIAVLVVILFIALTKPAQPIAQPSVNRFDPAASTPPSPTRLQELKKDLEDQEARAEKARASAEAAQAAAQKAMNDAANGRVPPVDPGSIPPPGSINARPATPDGHTVSPTEAYPGQYPAETPTSAAKPKTVSTIVQDLRQEAKAAPAVAPIPPAPASFPYPAAMPPSASTDQAPEPNNKPELKKVDLLRPSDSMAKVILPEGVVMESVLVNKLDGSATGEIKCMLTTDVYEPDTHRLLFPQGTDVVGETSTVSTFGQSRLAVKLHRAIVHQGDGHFYSVSLDQGMPGLDSEGATGLHGKVNNHWLSTFGVAGVVGGIAGLSEIGNTASALTLNPMSEFRTGVTQNMSQESMQIMSKFLNRPPTITIPPGTRVKLLTISDLEIPIFKEKQ